MRKLVVAVLAVVLLVGIAGVASCASNDPITRTGKAAVEAVKDTATTTVDSTASVTKTAVTETQDTGEAAVNAVADTAKSTVTGTKSIVKSAVGAGTEKK